MKKTCFMFKMTLELLLSAGYAVITSTFKNIGKYLLEIVFMVDDRNNFTIIHSQGHGRRPEEKLPNDDLSKHAYHEATKTFYRFRPPFELDAFVFSSGTQWSLGALLFVKTFVAFPEMRLVHVAPTLLLQL